MPKAAQLGSRGCARRRSGSGKALEALHSLAAPFLAGGQVEVLLGPGRSSMDCEHQGRSRKKQPRAFLVSAPSGHPPGESLLGLSAPTWALMLRGRRWRGTTRRRVNPRNVRPPSFQLQLWSLGASSPRGQASGLESALSAILKSRPRARMRGVGACMCALCAPTWGCARAYVGFRACARVRGW